MLDTANFAFGAFERFNSTDKDSTIDANIAEVATSPSRCVGIDVNLIFHEGTRDGPRRASREEKET